MATVSRRSFICSVPTMGLVAASQGIVVPLARAEETGESPPTVRPGYPRQMQEWVRGIVTVAHFDRDKVAGFLDEHPALVNAAWDWGFGDWETPLGAASHMGRRDIADLLLERGARIDIFAATMLGYTDVVKALVQARPGIQRTLGPHGITLLAHARAGGDAAKDALAFLKRLGDADPAPDTKPIGAEAQQRLAGEYRASDGSGDTMDVRYERGRLVIRVNENTPRALLHTGDQTFFPQGVPSVRIEFRGEGDAMELAITDHDVVVVAPRRAG